MSTQTQNSAVRARLPIELKQELEAIAQRRYLQVSDIVREALRDFVAKQPKVETNGNGTAKEQVAAV